MVQRPEGYVQGPAMHIAYVAGLLDGEGYITIGGNHHKDIEKGINHVKWHKRIGICNTNLLLILDLQAQFGGRTNMIDRERRGINWKQGYCWTLGGDKSVEFLKAVYPYLRIKHAQADLYIEFMATRHKPGQRDLPLEVVKQRFSLYKELVRLNSRGRTNYTGKLQLEGVLWQA